MHRIEVSHTFDYINLQFVTPLLIPKQKKNKIREFMRKGHTCSTTYTNLDNIFHRVRYNTEITCITNADVATLIVTKSEPYGVICGNKTYQLHHLHRRY